MGEVGTELELVAPQAGLSVPRPDELLGQVAELVEARDYRRVAELHAALQAQQLFEHRAGYLARERSFAKLRLLTEAALGAASFDDPSVGDTIGQGRVAAWRTLAAALERGRLERLLDDDTAGLDTTSVVARIKAQGLASVKRSTLVAQIKRTGADPESDPVLGSRVAARESVGWAAAREVARVHNIAFDKLPADAAALKRLRERKQELAEERERVRIYRDRYRADVQARLAKRMARDKEADVLGRAYSDLRQLLQRFQDLHESAPNATARDHVDEAIDALHRAEDHLGACIREW